MRAIQPSPDRSAAYKKVTPRVSRHILTTQNANVNREMSKTVRDGLHQGRFDTCGLSEDEARQAYLDRLDGILDTVFLAPFAAKMDAYRLGSFSVLHLIASERRSSRVQARIAQDRYDSIGVQYVVSGHAVGSTAKRKIVSDPGTIMILDYGQPFTVTDLEPRTVINVAVPRALFIERSSDPVTLHGAILTGPTALVLARFMETLGTVLTDIPKSCEAALARVFTDLLAVALGTVMSKDGVTDRDTRTIQRAEGLVDDRIGRSRSRVAREQAEPVAVGSLCGDGAVRRGRAVHPAAPPSGRSRRTREPCRPPSYRCHRLCLRIFERSAFRPRLPRSLRHDRQCSPQGDRNGKPRNLNAQPKR